MITFKEFRQKYRQIVGGDITTANWRKIAESLVKTGIHQTSMGYFLYYIPKSFAGILFVRDRGSF